MNKKVLFPIIGAALIVVILIVAIILAGGSDKPHDPDKTSERTSETVSVDGSSTDGIVSDPDYSEIYTYGPAVSEETIAGSAVEPDESEQDVVEDVPWQGGVVVNSSRVTGNSTSNQNSTTTNKANPAVSSTNTSKSDSTTTYKGEPDVTTTTNRPAVSTTTTTTTKPAVEPDRNLTYKEYISLSAAEQQAYFESFASIDDYFTWYNAAKKAYEDEQDRIEVTGEINIGDLIG